VRRLCCTLKPYTSHTGWQGLQASNGCLGTVSSGGIRTTYGHWCFSRKNDEVSSIYIQTYIRVISPWYASRIVKVRERSASRVSICYTCEAFLTMTMDRIYPNDRRAFRSARSVLVSARSRRWLTVLVYSLEICPGITKGQK
jgi:hypothetical protein